MMFIFILYIIETGAHFFFIPVAILVALLLFDGLVLAPKRKLIELINCNAAVFSDRRSWLKNYLSSIDYQRISRVKNKLLAKLLKGELEIGDYKKKTQDIKAYMANNHRINMDRKAYSLSLAFGPFSNDWRNGLHGAKWNMLLSAPFLFVLCLEYLENPHINLFPMHVAVNLLDRFFQFAIEGFFFGYFFALIRGNSGWKKGLVMAFAISACNLVPTLLLSESMNIAEWLAPILRRVIVYATLGFFLFDVLTLKRNFGHEFHWGMLVRIQGVRNLAAFGTVLTTAIVATVTTVLSGSLKTLVESIFNSFDPSNILP